MKYALQYIEQVLRVKPLGEVTFDECSEGEKCGYEVLIDGKFTGLEIWWVDYARWLEQFVKMEK